MDYIKIANSYFSLSGCCTYKRMKALNPVDYHVNTVLKPSFDGVAPSLYVICTSAHKLMFADVLMCLFIFINRSTLSAQ